MSACAPLYHFFVTGVMETASAQSSNIYCLCAKKGTYFICNKSEQQDVTLAQATSLWLC